MSPQYLIDQFREYIRLSTYTQIELEDRLSVFFNLGVITQAQRDEIQALITSAFV